LHPILIELVPWHFAVIGALVGLMLVSSYGGSLLSKNKVQLAAVIVIAMAIGAGGGWIAAGHFDFRHDPPKIHTFGPLVALGSFLAILYIRREGARRGLDPEALTGLAVEVLLVGVAGSRVLFILITQEAFPHDPLDSPLHSYFVQYLALWNGGLVWYGGLLPAAVFALWRAKRLGLPWRTIADVFAPAVMLGLGVGRIGCLMAGDDHGKLSPDGLPHWWTLTFTDKYALVTESLRGKPLWPSQPMMQIGDFMIFGICYALRKRLQNRPTGTMLVMMSLYPILRFFIEMIRGDVVRKFIWVWTTQREFDRITGTWKDVPNSGLSTSQAISIPLALMSMALLVRLLIRAPAGEEKPFAPSGDKPAEPATESAPKVAAPAAPAAAAPPAPAFPAAAAPPEGAPPV
jgi:phosphatidylglycerol:prolipoprotein diacylglycerol transferase